MANEFVARNGLIALDSSQITGSLSVSNNVIASSFTGSLLGTATSASFALTASSADNFNVRNTLTATTLVVQTITSSVSFVTGSTKFGSVNSNTHEFTGSVSISGSSVFGLDVNNGTLYVSASGNVGIGTTSPSDRLVVNGNLFLSGSSRSVWIGNNADSQPRFRMHHNGTDAYLDYSSSLYIRSGDASIRTTFTPAGSVGIGTTAPSYLLHAVTGSELTNPEVNMGVFYGFFNSSATLNTGVGILFGSNNNPGVALISQRTGANNEHALRIQTRNNAGNGATRMIVLGDGNVGIGTTAPTALLNISSSTASSLLRIDSAAGAGTLFVSSSGRVGIGTINPTTRLFVSNAANGNIVFVTNTVDADLAINLTSGVTLLSPTTTILSLGTSNTERMRISGSNVGIGITAPYVRLHVNGAVGSSTSDFVGSSTGTLIYMRTGLTTGNTYGLIQAGSAGDTIGANLVLNQFGGNVGIGTTAPVTVLHIETSTTAALPATSGTSQSGGHRIRMGTSGVGTGILDIGTAGGSGMWLQSTDRTSLSTNYALLLNPNGGNIGIGTTAPSARLDVSGSTVISGSLTVVTGSSIELQVTNTGVNIGNLITDTHNLTGSLNISGSLSISSSLLTYRQNLSIATGSFQTIVSIATGSYRCAFFDYVTFSGSVVRAGTVTTTWSGSTTEFYENFTEDLGGSTSVVTLQTAISGSNIELQAGISGSAWAVRSLVRLL